MLINGLLNNAARMTTSEGGGNDDPDQGRDNDDRHVTIAPLDGDGTVRGGQDNTDDAAAAAVKAKKAAAKRRGSLTTLHASHAWGDSCCSAMRMS